MKDIYFYRGETILFEEKIFITSKDKIMEKKKEKREKKKEKKK